MKTAYAHAARPDDPMIKEDPRSGLAAQTASVRHNNARAADVLSRLRILGDTVGGSVPMGASADANKAPTPQGHLAELADANGIMSSLLGFIEDETGRLEGLVG